MELNNHRIPTNPHDVVIIYAPRVPPRRRRTSNVRLPLELRSDRRETSATRVSDDLQISIFRRRIFCFRIFFFVFSSFSVDFRGARLFLTLTSSSSRFFALDGQIFRSVRRLELIFGFFTVRTSTCGEIYGEGLAAPTRQQRSEPGPPTRVFLVFKQD